MQVQFYDAGAEPPEWHDGRDAICIIRWDGPDPDQEPHHMVMRWNPRETRWEGAEGSHPHVLAISNMLDVFKSATPLRAHTEFYLGGRRYPAGPHYVVLEVAEPKTPPEF